MYCWIIETEAVQKAIFFGIGVPNCIVIKWVIDLIFERNEIKKRHKKSDKADKKDST